jgi:CheY-like chemotaxis protein
MDLEQSMMDVTKLHESISQNPQLKDIFKIYLTNLDTEINDFSNSQPEDIVLTTPLKQSHLFDALIHHTYTELRQFDSKDIAVSEASKEEEDLGENDKLTILIVEDNQINQMLAQVHLEKLGFLSHVVANGQEALEELANHYYEIILMDCQMPIMNGYQATAAIRRIQRLNKIKKSVIIAMTANAMKGDAEKCLAAGMDDYLSKPIDRVKLNMTLKKWISKNNLEKPSKIQELSDDDNILILTAFVNTMSSVIESIQEYYNKKDYENLSITSHGLKSSSLAVGAKKLSEICFKIEKYSLTPELLPELENLIPQLITEANIVKNNLSHQLKR